MEPTGYKQDEVNTLVLTRILPNTTNTPLSSPALREP